MAHPKETDKQLMLEMPDNGGLQIWKVHIDALKEQKKNARVMSNKMFARLRDDIGGDKRLESMPFCHVNEKGQFEIISGHHRARAARMASVNHIYVLVDPKTLTRDQVVSKQLAHNAIAGQDDQQMLAELWQEIQSLDEKLKTGLEPEDLGVNKFDPMSVSGLAFQLDAKTILLGFLPAGFARFEETIQFIGTHEQINLADLKAFEPFVSAASSPRCANPRGRMSMPAADSYAPGRPRSPPRTLRTPHCRESSSIPGPALAAHFHWVFHCVMPESQLSGVLARR